MSLQLHATAAEPYSPQGSDEVRLEGHPGSRVFIELRTAAAYRLVIGRPPTEHKPGIIGLLAFASLLRDIWAAAKTGDPFARWWLLKIEAAITRAETIVEPALTSVRKALAASAPLEIDLRRGHPPRRLDLLFACPYAYYGARLVKQLDVLVLALDTGVDIGALRKADTTMARLPCEKALRHVFASSQGYCDFGLSSEVIERHDPKAVDAAARMGTVPDDVLSGERWPALMDRYTVTSCYRSGHGDD